MKILLFGGSGQLGSEIRKRTYDLNFEFIAPVTSEVDISNKAQVKKMLSDFKPNVVINTAAYTAVDKAETEQDLAMKINKTGAEVVAEFSQLVGSKLIHISTDYVYSGDGNSPVYETDQIGPKSVYGKTKLLGEEAVMEATKGNAIILRTSSLFGVKGPNFVATMMKLFREGQNVRVVDDQWMSPTWAGWLAEVILDLSRIKTDGVFNASCEGGITWYEFAKEILKRTSSKENYPDSVKVEPIKVSEFARPAERPRYSVMNCDKLASVLGRIPISWQAGLDGYLEEYYSDK